MIMKSLVLASVRVSKTFLIPFFLVCAFFAVSVAPAQAQDKESAEVSAALSDSIAILDMQQLLNSSKAAESIRSQIEKRRNSYQKDIKKDEEKLRGMEKELIKQREILSKEAFVEKNKEFQGDIIEAQKSINEKKYKLDKSFADAMTKLREEIVKITAKIAAKEKYALVLSRQQVVIVDQNMDITDQVMKELNSSVKSISVK